MTQAEQLLKVSREEIEATAVRRQRHPEVDHIEQFTFADGSIIHIRKLSGRSAFAANGWHLKST